MRATPGIVQAYAQEPIPLGILRRQSPQDAHITAAANIPRMAAHISVS
jgi:hypothetical protein